MMRTYSKNIATIKQIITINIMHIHWRMKNMVNHCVIILDVRIKGWRRSNNKGHPDSSKKEFKSITNIILAAFLSSPSIPGGFISNKRQGITSQHRLRKPTVHCKPVIKDNLDSISLYYIINSNYRNNRLNTFQRMPIKSFDYP